MTEKEVAKIFKQLGYIRTMYNHDLVIYRDKLQDKEIIIHRDGHATKRAVCNHNALYIKQTECVAIMEQFKAFRDDIA